LSDTALEPVAWAYVNTDGECEQIEWGDPPDDPSIIPLYARPEPALPPPAMEAMIKALQQAESDMTCINEGDAHYCPQCGNSSCNARDKIKAALKAARGGE
jgi:hypothetical protein